MTLSLLILGTVGIFSIITTREVNHLVKCKPEEIVAFMIVLMVWRMALSKVACSGLSSSLSETKIYNDRGVFEMEMW